MEEVYAALLLHKLGKPVDEQGVTTILQAGGAHVDESKVKSLIASLKDVNIDTELANAVVMSASAVSTAVKEEKKEEVKEEKHEAAAEGLSALFG